MTGGYWFAAWVAVSCLVASVRWRAGLVLLFAVGSVQDGVRKCVLEAPAVIVLATVPIWMGVLVGLIRARELRLGPVWWDSRLVQCAGLAFAILLLRSAAHTSAYSPGAWQLPLLGCFPFLSVFLGIAVGQSYPRTAADPSRSDTDLRYILGAYCVVVSIVLIGVPFERAMAEHPWPSLGSQVLRYTWFRVRDDGGIHLLSGFYRSPDIMGWHATMLCMLAACLMLTARGWRRGSWGLVAAWGLVGSMFCGRRKMFFMIPLFAMVLLVLLHAKTRSWRLVLKVCGGLFALAIAGTFIYVALGSSSGVGAYYFESGRESLGRIWSHGFQEVAYSARGGGWLGQGLGLASLGAHHLDIPNRPRMWQESGLGRVVVELGLLGLASFLALIAAVATSVLRSLLRSSLDDRRFLLVTGLYGVCAANLASFVMSHQVFGDPFISTMLGVVIGTLIFGAREHAPPRARAVIGTARWSRARKWLVDTAAVAFVTTLAFHLWGPTWGTPDGRQIYVSPRGQDWSDGAGRDCPLRTLQRAADRARPGDTVVLLPGLYRERVVIRQGGQPGRSVTFCAEVPGTVTISGQAPPGVVSNLAWRDDGGGVYSAATPWPVFAARVGDEALFRTWTLDALRRFGAMPGARYSFTYEAERLHVFVPGGRPPNAHALTLHDRIPARQANGVWRAANVWLQADHVRFADLRFDFGVGASIHLANATNVTIEGCAFSGAQCGVSAASGLKPSTDLRIERCLYHNYPQGEWLAGWLPWNEVYSTAAESTFVRSIADGAELHRNLVVHASDGMVVTTRNAPPRKGIAISQNLIAWCTDDAFELDGFSRGINVERNLVYDVHESLGLSPVLEGPIEIRGNVFLHPTGGLNGAQLKLINSSFGKPGLDGPISNVCVEGNTFVGRHLCFTDRRPVRNVSVRRNLFAVREMISAWPPGMVDEGNEYVVLPLLHANPGTDQRWRQRTPVGIAGTWPMERPGPRWLDWSAHPATARLASALAREWLER